MPQLTPEQVSEFLATSMIARLATVKADSTPYGSVAPVEVIPPRNDRGERPA